MTNDPLASMRAGAENLDKLHEDLPGTVARMRAAGCSEELVLLYQPLLVRTTRLFNDLKGAVLRNDVKTSGAIGEQLQAEQAKLLGLVQSIWKSAKQPHFRPN